jgi:periplasmic protein TonB
MYGAMREHAPSSTRLAGVITAATATLAFGYAMANGMGAYIVQHMPETLIYVPLPDKPLAERTPPPTSDLPLASDAHELVSPLTEFPRFIPEDGVTGAPPKAFDGDIGPSTPPPPNPPPAVRTRAMLIPGAKPSYPPTEIRNHSEGISSLELCIDTNGRVTAANLASSSGHRGLDEAALKWVRSARFKPAKVNGTPQSICGHSVSYEWRLENR